MCQASIIENLDVHVRVNFFYKQFKKLVREVTGYDRRKSEDVNKLFLGKLEEVDEGVVSASVLKNEREIWNRRCRTICQRKQKRDLTTEMNTCNICKYPPNSRAS